MISSQPNSADQKAFNDHRFPRPSRSAPPISSGFHRRTKPLDPEDLGTFRLRSTHFLGLGKAPDDALVFMGVALAADVADAAMAPRYGEGEAQGVAAFLEAYARVDA